jgi:hypothetical protein
LNPRTWVPKVSTLPVDHRSRRIFFSRRYLLQINFLIPNKSKFTRNWTMWINFESSVLIIFLTICLSQSDLLGWWH